MTTTPKRDITLGHLTVERLAPPQLVTQAAAAGFEATGIRFWDGFTDRETYPLRPGSPMLKETQQLLASNGLKVVEVENIVINPTTDPEKYRFLFETGAILGARRVIVGSIVEDEALGTDLFARLCAVAAEYGLDIALEFYLKWHGCASIEQGRRILRNAGQNNGKLLIDALHLMRSGGSPTDVAETDAAIIGGLQICDAPAAKPADLDAISFESRFARLLPGEGGLPLKEIVQAYPAECQIGIEIPYRTLEDEIGSQEFLRRCYVTTRQLLQDANM